MKKLINDFLLEELDLLYLDYAYRDPDEYYYLKDTSEIANDNGNRITFAPLNVEEKYLQNST